MTVETERANDGHMTFRLGPVERWVVAAGAAALLASGYRAYSTITDRLDEQAQGQQAIVTQMAVMNSNWIIISKQLADVPAITNRVTTLESKQADLLRRQDHDEQLRENANSNLREWQKP